jgi:Flp pilus assembly pilin Flp
MMQWLRRQKGQDLTEYALIIALIVILAVVAVQALGGSIQSVLQNIADTLSGALGG